MIKEIDFCLLGENAPAHLCITGVNYKKVGLGYIKIADRESPSTALARKYKIDVNIINALMKAHPNQDGDVVMQKYGPASNMYPITHWGQTKTKTRALMKPAWEFGPYKRYTEEEYRRCLAIVNTEKAKVKQKRENFNRKVQLQHRKRSKDEQAN